MAKRKTQHSPRERRQADHIADGYEKRGVDSEEAERRAWATVNKQKNDSPKSKTNRAKRSK